MMITFPEFTGLRCLMMPFVQGDHRSVPESYHGYAEIIDRLFFRRGDVGYLTIDESSVVAGCAHRAAHAKHGRALHTEAGRLPGPIYNWGGGVWGGNPKIPLDPDVRVLIASNLDDSCAVWDAEHLDTTVDGDIGHCADLYPYSSARLLKRGEVYEIGILTPHESLPVSENCDRQFLRIVSSGVRGREDYFTDNPLLSAIETKGTNR